MTTDEVRAFAEKWIDAWNRRDAEAVLAHFDDNVVFTSPTALAVVGVSTLHGKAAVRMYWSAALAHIRSLHFVLDRFVWDPTSRELAIIYVSEVNGEAKQVSEHLQFDTSGRVTRGEVFHGATRPPGTR
jgi:hypothetical protein